MITVHHLNLSRSQRVLWALEELEVPYEIVKYERDPKTLLAPSSLQKIHPLGKSPVIVDHTAPPFGGAASPSEAGLVEGDATLAESGAIIEYLVDKYGAGRLAPAKDTQAYRHYRYFMHYAEGSLMPILLLTLIMTKIKTAKVPFFIKPISGKISDKVMADFVTPNLTRHIAFLGQHLDKNKWFAGDELSAADIQMSYAVEALVSRAKSLNLSPTITALHERMLARPAYQRALAKGGPVIPE